MTKAQRAPKQYEFRLPIIVKKAIWKKMALIAGRKNTKIQDVANELIEAYFEALPAELQPRGMGGGPTVNGWNRFYLDLVPGAKEQARLTPPAPGVEPLPPPPPPSWNEIWPRIHNQLHVAESWEEFLFHLKGVVPPEELMKYPMDWQITWLNTYAPLEGR